MNKLEIALIKRVCKLEKKITSLEYDNEAMKISNIEIDENLVSGKIDIDENDCDNNYWADKAYDIFLENEELQKLIIVKDQQISDLLETNLENKIIMYHHNAKMTDEEFHRFDDFEECEKLEQEHHKLYCQYLEDQAHEEQQEQYLINNQENDKYNFGLFFDSDF